MKQYSPDIGKVHTILMEEYARHKMPVVELIQAQTKEPFNVLVATILSARTKDQTTAEVVKRLFKDVKKADDFRRFTVEEIEKIIYPVGFFREKAKHLKKLPDVLDDKFKGIIPDTVEELIELPGVGRKTANLVVAIGFNLPAICVDIHVHRISNRLGYLTTKNPLETEMALRKHLPEKYWITYNSCFVSFGQNTCSPINPKCNICPIYKYCSRVNVKSKFLQS